jgi:hypothetical protein
MTSRAPDDRGEFRDDPFARAAGAEPTVAGAGRRASGRLARRDPHAPVETSGELDLSGAISFDDLLRGARRRGFLAGIAVGAIAVVVAAVALTWLTAGPPVRVATVHMALPQAGEPIVAAPATPPPRVTASAPPADPAAERRSPQAALTGRRRAPALRALEAAPALLVPGLVLSAPEEPAAEVPAAAPPLPAPGSGPLDAPATPGSPARQLEEQEVVAALDARREAMAGCIAAHPADVAEARARRFHLVVTVDQTGRVARARLDDPDLGATALGSCVVRLARELRFEPFDGEPVRVELPLRLADE